MFEDHGLTFTQIGLLFIIWKTSASFFEYPSGILADKYSRKWQLVIAQILFALCFVSWTIGNSFWNYALGFVFWGINGALKSGTFQAFIYDQLKSEGKENHFKKVYTNTKSFTYSGIIVSSLFAGLIFSYGQQMSVGGYNLALVTSIMSVILSIVPLFLIQESKIYKTTGETDNFSHFKESYKAILSSKILLTLVLVMTAYEGFGVVVEENTTLFVRSTGLPNEWLGIYNLILGICVLLSTIVIARVKNFDIKYAAILILISGFALTLAGLANNYLVWGLFLIDAFFVEVIGIPFEDKIQKLSPSNIRASISSLNGFMVRILSLLIFFLFGLISDEWGINWGYFGLGVCSLIIGFLILTKLTKNM